MSLQPPNSLPQNVNTGGNLGNQVQIVQVPKKRVKTWDAIFAKKNASPQKGTLFAISSTPPSPGKKSSADLRLSRRLRIQFSADSSARRIYMLGNDNKDYFEIIERTRYIKSGVAGKGYVSTNTDTRRFVAEKIREFSEKERQRAGTKNSTGVSNRDEAFDISYFTNPALYRPQSLNTVEDDFFLMGTMLPIIDDTEKDKRTERLVIPVVTKEHKRDYFPPGVRNAYLCSAITTSKQKYEVPKGTKGVRFRVPAILFARCSPSTLDMVPDSEIGTIVYAKLYIYPDKYGNEEEDAEFWTAIPEFYKVDFSPDCSKSGTGTGIDTASTA